MSAEGPAPDTVQVLSERTGLPGTMVLDADTVRTVLGMLQGPRISDDAWVHEVKVSETEEGIDVTVSVGTEEKPNVPIAEAKQDVFTRLGARPDAVVRVSMDQPSTRRIAARTMEVPGYGWSPFEPAALAHPVEASEDGAVALSNGLVRVEVDAADGTFSLGGVHGYGRLVDGGDLGDSYNYSPPRQDSFVDTPGRRDGGAGRARPGPRHASGSLRPTSGLTMSTGPHRRVSGATVSRWTPTLSCAPTTRSSVSRPASSTRAATTACGCTCPCPSRRRSRTPRVPSPS